MRWAGLRGRGPLPTLRCYSSRSTDRQCACAGLDQMGNSIVSLRAGPDAESFKKCFFSLFFFLQVLRSDWSWGRHGTVFLKKFYIQLSLHLILLLFTMPGVADRMELRKVSTEVDDDSTDSLDDHFSEPIEPEKATINRFLFLSPHESS